MTHRAEYLFIASMDVDHEREQLFNQVYDDEHIPALSKVPGVHRVNRYRNQKFTLSIAGQLRHIEPTDPKYYAVFELDSPDVLVSREWATAIEIGRWPTDVRPFTRNRHHLLIKGISD